MNMGAFPGLPTLLLPSTSIRPLTPHFPVLYPLELHFKASWITLLLIPTLKLLRPFTYRL